MTDEQKGTFTKRITQANKSELIVILYEMYLIYIEDAVKARENGDLLRENIKKARGCLDELTASLNYDYEVSGRILQLYRFVHREMIKADARKSIEPLLSCEKIMKELCDAYKEVSRQDLSAPVMGNTQTVYAGLTYGKGELTESMAEQGNRGFFA